ncbi:MAG: hypothetical protein ACREAC_33310, partial [Blastocatellia bacterium]
RNLKEAIECRDAAKALLVDAEDDYLREDFQTLKLEIERLERIPKPVYKVERGDIGKLRLKEILNQCERDVVNYAFHELCDRNLNKTWRMLKTGERRVKKWIETNAESRS